jgi:suppressor for copper-sensitivity B
MLRAPLRFAFLAASLVAAAVAGQGFAPIEKATVDVQPERSAFPPGATARLAVWMEIDPGWHTNSHRPTFDYLIPTTLEIEPPAGWRVEGIDYPAGEHKTFSFEEQPLSVYEGRIGIVARLAVPEDAESGEVAIEAALTYQACDDRSCLPPVTERQTVALTVGSDGRRTGVEMPASPGERRAPADLAWILLLGLVGGLVLNAMPCVLPVLSLKVLGLVKSAGQSRRAVSLGALVTSLGILLSFWALAVAAIAAKSAGAAVGWGVQFQEPAVVAALAVVVLLLTLNQWGLFEIPLPSRLASAAAGGPSEGLPGHLASGLFATLMATPCSAPFLGTAVGFGLAQPPLTILAVFTAIAVGMSLPYLALAVFPAAARWLPRPGPWMANLKVLMGFLLAAAAVWLLYVLSAQLPAERVAFVELALLALAACVWWRHRAARGAAGRRLATVGIVAAAIGTLLLAAGARPHTERSPTAGSAGLIAWLPFDRAEAEALRDEGRLVFVDVTADWCFTCKVNERLVLETPAVAAAFAEHEVIAMKADWTNRNDAIAAFLADHGRYGIPFYLLYRPDDEPVVFSELLTQDAVVRAVRSPPAR